ncbi:MAG: M61 family metallopeptidase [Acidobacteria bacterium]|nr:M61 family metallopeptidase [Acidobacteriota bacterium]MBV9626045.1 M61 family metallopeptidase [Acidobacteriota bacterium]
MHGSNATWLMFLLLAASPAIGTETSAPHLTIALDASEAARKILHARLTIPAAPGTMTLYYPKWIPGEHTPSGPVVNLAGLKFTGNGQLLNWRRALDDNWAVNVEVPPGIEKVDASLDYLSTVTADQASFSAGASATEKMAVISWNENLLYPKGWTADEITYSASLRLPSGWKFATPLAVESRSGDEVRFIPVSLYTLVDSPVIAGEYFKMVPLNDGQNPPAELDLVADSPGALDVPAEVWDKYRNLVKEAATLFGATHYRDYHFLFSLSDHVAHFGLEHHESNDSRTEERALTNPELRMLHASLLSHEYVHSWNGKYRRPVGLATSDYQQIMQDDLLWVYEGLTEYLGNLLTARSGLWTADQYRDNLAEVAAEMDHRSGRSWRNLQDTADSAAQLFAAPAEWESWRRGVDFYVEGELDWLWADTIIREQSRGKKSLDDFCRIFHGGSSTPPLVKSYTFDDVVSGLNQVIGYDWRGFWSDRLSNHGPGAPLGGIERSGWKLVYDENRSEMTRAWEEDLRTINASYSLGLTVKEDGEIGDTVEGMVAARAGIGPGMKVIAVNGRRFTPQVFRDSLAAAKPAGERFELLVENTDYFRTVGLDYHRGESYPHLVRDQSRPDLLSDIVRAR